MIISSNLIPKGFDAITVWPFILVRPNSRNDIPLITHELVHYKEQRSCGVVPWLLRYAFSKNFRLQAELRGYKAQMLVAGGITAHNAANYLIKYGTGITYEQAVDMMNSK